MHRLLFRFTLRQLMITVAITAIMMGSSIWAVRMSQRARQFKRLAEGHAELEAAYRINGRAMSEPAFEFYKTMDPKWAEGFMAYRRTIEHHAQMQRKYNHATSYPWEFGSPDPPEPPLLWEYEAPDGTVRQTEKNVVIDLRNE